MIRKPLGQPRGSAGAARACGWALAVLLALGAGPARADTEPDREHRVKAVFLFNFAQFVEWPDSAFAGPHDPLVVGILGDDPFDAFLDEVVKGESVHDRPIVVKRYKRLEDVKDCHVLFIGAGETPRFEGILKGLRDRHILTVGETDEFFRRGGMVCFANEGGKVRLKINLEAVQEAALTVSSKLLRLADTSGPRKE
jgi:hypothetical protein